MRLFWVKIFCTYSLSFSEQMNPRSFSWGCEAFRNQNIIFIFLVVYPFSTFSLVCLCHKLITFSQRWKDKVVLQAAKTQQTQTHVCHRDWLRMFALLSRHTATLSAHTYQSANSEATPRLRRSEFQFAVKKCLSRHLWSHLAHQYGRESSFRVFVQTSVRLTVIP